TRVGYRERIGDRIAVRRQYPRLHERKRWVGGYPYLGRYARIARRAGIIHIRGRWNRIDRYARLAWVRRIERRPARHRGQVLHPARVLLRLRYRVGGRTRGHFAGGERGRGNRNRTLDLRVAYSDVIHRHV